MQETQVWSLVRQDPTCHGATKPRRHKHWACAWEPGSTATEARRPWSLCSQQEKPLQWEACALQLEWPPLTIREKPSRLRRPEQSKLKKTDFFKVYFFYNYSETVRNIYKRLFQSNKEVKHYYQNWNENSNCHSPNRVDEVLLDLRIHRLTGQLWMETTIPCFFQLFLSCFPLGFLSLSISQAGSSFRKHLQFICKN